MPRQVRIEFAGAMYHVMARGDRREAIVKDEEDRRTFVRTLGEAAERAGFRVHAWVLMSNHYHLLLETPEPNLSQGMGWLQNAYTRRINTRHGLWGHVFGGRYKAILVEPGNCYWALLDYIHLNPVRAGLVKREEGLESCRWSSLPGYLGEPGKRSEWLETGMGLAVTGCRDTASGRRRFLEILEERVDWSAPGKAGREYSSGEGETKLAVYSSLKRGWFFGSQAFKERLLGMMEERLAGRMKRRGIQSAAAKDHGEWQARRLVDAGLLVFGTSSAELKNAAKSDWRKGLLAEMIQRQTTMKLVWISEKLRMGDPSSCCRVIQKVREKLPRQTEWRESQKRIEIMSRNHA